jgi:hypothetical protein
MNEKKSNRYWVSWWSGNYEEEGCKAPPFDFWVSGQRERRRNGLSQEQYDFSLTIRDEDEYDNYIDKYAKDDCSICALIDASGEEEIWQEVAKYFPDYEQRFCEQKDADYSPGAGGRFTGGKGRTSLYFSN